MKRSRRIATLAAGGATLLVLTACGEEPQVFSGVEQCAMETGDRRQCEIDFAAAEQAHAETAPKFEQQASCEEQYGVGNCVPAGQQAGMGGGFFMPMMMGYMMGRMFSGVSQPVYYDRGGYAYTRGKPAPAGLGLPSRAPGAATPAGMRRGGFGGTAGAAYSAGS